MKKHAEPLPILSSAAAPADVAAVAKLVTDRLHSIRWLCGHAESQEAIDNHLWWSLIVHQALAQAVMLMRTAFHAGGYTANAMLPPVAQQVGT